MMTEIPKTATGKWSKQALHQRFTDRLALKRKHRRILMPIEPRLVVTGHSPDGDAVFVEDRRPEPVSVQACLKPSST
jgi:hypothetical protein